MIYEHYNINGKNVNGKEEGNMPVLPAKERTWSPSEEPGRNEKKPDIYRAFCEMRANCTTINTITK